MKDKELFNYIKSSTDNIKINDYSDSIIENSHHEIKPKSLIHRKNRYIFPLTLGSSLGAIGIVSISLAYRGYSNKGGNNNINFSEKLYQNTSYEFVTIGNVLNSKNDLKKSKAYSEDEFKSMTKDVNDYIFSCEQLIDSENILYVQKENDNNKFDYDYQMIISYENSDIYCYYDVYNKKNDKSKMEGVVVINDNVYNFDGKRENDDEEDELTMYVYLSDKENKTYIKIENEREFEDDEIEFEYKITEYENGNEISKVEFEINIEEDETTFEIEKEINKVKEQYKFKINKDNKKLKEESICTDALYFIEAEVEKTDYENIDFKIYVYENKYVYYIDDYDITYEILK